MGLKKIGEQEVLEKLRGKREISSSLEKRGEVVLSFYYEHQKKSEILRSVSMSSMTLNRWLERWKSNKKNREMWFEWYESETITEQEYSNLVLSVMKPPRGKPRGITRISTTTL